MSCFHCGTALPTSGGFVANIDDAQHEMCCPGCVAVAELIYGQGLSDYYRLRTDTPSPIREQTDEFAQYDLDALKANFVQVLDEHKEAATLLVENMQCAACVWLVEEYLQQLDGVISVRVSLDSHRVYVEWDSRKLSPSKIFNAISSLGYVSFPYHNDKASQILASEQKQLLTCLGIAGIGMAQVMIYAIALYAGFFHGMSEAHQQLFRWISFVIATPVVFFAAKPLYRRAWQRLKYRQLSMDIPIVLAISLAYGASVINTFLALGDVYYDSVSMFIFFLLVSRLLEIKARYQAGSPTHALFKLLPQSVIQYSGEKTQVVSLNQLQLGSRVLIRQGDAVPADGVVLSGESQIDESMLTGEHRPVNKKPGTSVYAGTLNLGDSLIIQVKSIEQNTRLASIIRLLEQAQSDKPQTLRWIDFFAKYWVSGLLLIAVCVYFVWRWIDPSRAFEVTLALLVVSCPCALSLAIPTVFIVAAGRLQKLGFLITRGHVFECLLNTTDIVFDKTGTLTTDKMRLNRVTCVGSLSETQCMNIANALESHSAHPIAKAFSRQSALTANMVKLVAGCGIEGQIEQQRFRIGNIDFIREWHPKLSIPAQEVEPFSHLIVLASPLHVLAWFELTDELRPDVELLFEKLHQLPIQLHLLTGDDKNAAKTIAQQVGIQHIVAQATPEMKLDYLHQLRAHGNRVTMIGDGINDIPIIAAADLSISLEHSPELAQVHSDAIIMGGSFRPLLAALEVSQLARRMVKQNLTWALSYNLITIPLAAVGLIPPYLAAIGMSASTLLVVFNALRIK